MKITARNMISVFFILSGLLAGCVSGSPAANSIMAYLKAIASRDANEVSVLSCSEWESQAKTDFESFSAVTVDIENASCSETGKDGDYMLVSCTGKMVANYGNEVMEIDLADRTYQALYEGGEWRMCGYR